MIRKLESDDQGSLNVVQGDKARLSQELSGSIHPLAESLPQEEIDAAWEAEVERRVAEIENGAAVLYSLEEVEADLNSIIRKAENARRP